MYEAVATALRISPTTLYKYDLNRDDKCGGTTPARKYVAFGAAIEQQFYTNRFMTLQQNSKQERQRSKNLIARIATMEANAARLGFDPERCTSRS